jgi:DNA-binding GntR family transcriptional regulator
MVEALEGMATYLVAEKYKSGNLVKRDISNLKKLVEKMDQALEVSDLNEWSKSDEEFHNEITRLCRNHYIKDEYIRLRTQLNCVLWFITPIYIDKSASNQEHHMVLEAILEKDPDKARQAAQNHRNRVRKELMHLLH